jgi:hypothetical protein
MDSVLLYSIVYLRKLHYCLLCFGSRIENVRTLLSTPQPKRAGALKPNAAGTTITDAASDMPCRGIAVAVVSEVGNWHALSVCAVLCIQQGKDAPYVATLTEV